MALLKIQALKKSYAAPVLKGLGFSLEAGEVHALVGANGAGKSTLARIIAGITPADAGQMQLKDQVYHPRHQKEARDQGIHMIMQELNLIPTLTVAENLFCDRLPHKFGVLQKTVLHQRARQALARVALDDLDPDQPLGDLGVGQQQLIEIAAALAQDAQLLILDEPTAALTAPQVEILFTQMRKLKAQGVGMIYISHRVEEMKAIADRLSVLRDGQIVLKTEMRDLSADQVLEAMLGEQPTKRDGKKASHRASKQIDQPLALEVKGLCCGPLVQDVSFKLYQGEILGLAGLVGSGRSETLRALFGADRPSKGDIRIGPNSKSLWITHPKDAVNAGLAFLPEDRKAEGLLLRQSIRLNTTLSRLDLVSKFGVIDSQQEEEIVNAQGQALNLQSQSLEQRCQELSGGNQQKVVLGRWLLRDCQVLLLDEPTRGIDVATKQLIYALLRDLAHQGKSLLVVSSELPELMGLCDRIAVMSDGRLVKTFNADEFNEEAIMSASFSAYLKEKAS